MAGSCASSTATMANGRHLGSVARNSRTAVCSRSLTLAARGGGIEAVIIGSMGQSGNLTDRRRDQASIAGLLAAAMAAPMATPRLDAEVLLAHVMGRPRAYLI